MQVLKKALVKLSNCVVSFCFLLNAFHGARCDDRNRNVSQCDIFLSCYMSTSRCVQTAGTEKQSPAAHTSSVSSWLAASADSYWTWRLTRTKGMRVLGTHALDANVCCGSKIVISQCTWSKHAAILLVFTTQKLAFKLFLRSVLSDRGKVARNKVSRERSQHVVG